LAAVVSDDRRSEVAGLAAEVAGFEVVPDREVLFGAPDMPTDRLLSSPELRTLLAFSSAELPIDTRERWVVLEAVVGGPGLRAVAVAVGRIGGLLKVLPAPVREAAVDGLDAVVEVAGRLTVVAVPGFLGVAAVPFCGDAVAVFSFVALGLGLDISPSVGAVSGAEGTSSTDGCDGTGSGTGTGSSVEAMVFGFPDTVRVQGVNSTSSRQVDGYVCEQSYCRSANAGLFEVHGRRDTAEAQNPETTRTRIEHNRQTMRPN
jgi:hypothetical protein